MPLTKWDGAAVLLVLLLSAVSLLFPILAGSDGGMLIIDSETGRREIPLSASGDYEIHSGGHTLTVRIEDGGAAVIGSDCPDKLCMGLGRMGLGHMGLGRIDKAGQSIACVPAGVLITVGGEGDADAVAG